MKKQKDKVGIIVGLGVTALVLITMLFYIQGTNGMSLEEYVMVGIVAFLVLSATYIVAERAKNMKKGFPTEDEFSKKVNYKASSNGFIAAIWTAVFAGFFENIITKPTHVTALVVLVSGTVFILSYIYMIKRGSVE